LNCTTFSKDLLRIFKLLFCPEYASGVFLHGMYAFTHYINTTSVKHKTVCTIQFQALLVCLYLLMAYAKVKLKSNCNK